MRWDLHCLNVAHTAGSTTFTQYLPIPWSKPSEKNMLDDYYWCHHWPIHTQPIELTKLWTMLHLASIVVGAIPGDMIHTFAEPELALTRYFQEIGRPIHEYIGYLRWSKVKSLQVAIVFVSSRNGIATCSEFCQSDGLWTLGHLGVLCEVFRMFTI